MPSVDPGFTALAVTTAACTLLLGGPVSNSYLKILGRYDRWKDSKHN